jgi:hypothetical protein
MGADHSGYPFACRGDPVPEKEKIGGSLIFSCKKGRSRNGCDRSGIFFQHPVANDKSAKKSLRAKCQTDVSHLIKVFAQTRIFARIHANWNDASKSAHSFPVYEEFLELVRVFYLKSVYFSKIF